MIRSDKRIRLCCVLLVCNLAFIWGNSLMPGEVSGAFSDWVKAFLEQLMPGEDDGLPGGGLLRKMAHFTEFGLLGMCLGWLFGMLRKKKTWPIALGVAAACVDETIQRYVPGRESSLVDVWIDIGGVCTGILLLHLGYCCIRRRKERKQNF